MTDIEKSLIEWWDEFYRTRDIVQDLYKQVYGIPIYFFGENEHGNLFSE